MEPILEEKQKFNQLLIWLPMIALLVFVLQKYYYDMSTSNLISLIIVGVLILFIISITLKYSIFKEEINISYFPFFRKKIFRKEEISEVSVVTYSPLFDFGGWGLRYGKNGTTGYNIKGNIGIYIVLKNGKKYLVGSQLDKTVLLEKLKIVFETVDDKKF